MQKLGTGLAYKQRGLHASKVAAAVFYTCFTLVFAVSTVLPQGAVKADPPPTYLYTRASELSASGDALTNGAATDSSNNTFVAGDFTNTVTFDGPGGSDTRTTDGSHPATFITKRSSDGSYAWTKTVDSSAGFTSTRALAVGPLGEIYVAGFFYDTVVFDGVGGSDSITSANQTSFLTKYNSDGSYAWTNTFDTAAGGAQADGIGVDPSGNVYIGGLFYGTTIFDGPGGSDSATTVGQNTFVTKYSSSGAYGWTSYFDTSSTASFQVGGLAVDLSGNAYVTGYVNGAATFGGSDSVSTGNQASFLVKYATSGAYQYARTFDVDSFGGGGYSDSQAVATDATGNIYFGGSFSGSVIFDGAGGSDTGSAAGSNCAYITKYNSNGTYGWTKRVDDTNGLAVVYGIVTDTDGNVYTTGGFQGDIVFDGPGGSDTQSDQSVDSFDNAFITRRTASDGTYGWTKSFDTTNGIAGGQAVAVDTNNYVYVAGYAADTVVFDGPGGSDSRTFSNGFRASFVTKYDTGSVGGGSPGSGGTGGTGGAGGGPIITKPPITRAPTTEPEPSTPTQAGELKLDVNLTNGQEIAGKYTIIVTPQLTSTGTYNSVAFYVDNQHIGTYHPNDQAITTWEWDTGLHPGSQVKIIVYEGGVAKTSWEFIVRMSRPLLTAAPAQSATDGWPISYLRSLPLVVTLAFPYLLLSLLFILILLLLYQARREVQEAKKQRAAFERARQLGDAKDGFIALTSHYIRTPITLLKGGFSMAQPQLSQLARALDEFSAVAESLLGRASQTPAFKAIEAGVASKPPKKATQSVLFWLPLLAIGPAVLLFDGVAIVVGVAGVTFTHVMAHVLVYVILAVGLYVVIRNTALTVRDREVAEQQAAQQASLDATRNQFIRSSAEQLGMRLAGIKQMLARLPEGDAKKFSVEGYSRIAETLDRFRSVATITAVPANAPFTAFTAGALVASSEQPLGVRARDVTAVQGQEAMLASQQPSWVRTIVTSVLDNALSYNQPNHQVTVAATTSGKDAVITVHDDGQGIPQDKLAELMQPFAKAEGAMQFDHPGLGLSLYQARLMLAGLGGQLHIESAQGKGTTVQLAFPVKP